MIIIMIIIIIIVVVFLLHIFLQSTFVSSFCAVAFIFISLHIQGVFIFHLWSCDDLINSCPLNLMPFLLRFETIPKNILKQAQRRAAAGRSRYKSHGVIQY